MELQQIADIPAFRILYPEAFLAPGDLLQLPAFFGQALFNFADAGKQRIHPDAPAEKGKGISLKSLPVYQLGIALDECGLEMKMLGGGNGGRFHKNMKRKSSLNIFTAK